MSMGQGTHWEDDSIQFPRLLAEIAATQDSLDEGALCDSMNIDHDELNELFNRAQSSWENIKETHT